MVQPPARSSAHAAMLGCVIVQDENRDHRPASGNRRTKRALISQAEVAAEPEDLGHALPYRFGRPCMIRALEGRSGFDGGLQAETIANTRILKTLIANGHIAVLIALNNRHA
jgi:hypothetical protein